jgi:hypothetical protein
MRRDFAFFVGPRPAFKAKRHARGFTPPGDRTQPVSRFATLYLADVRLPGVSSLGIPLLAPWTRSVTGGVTLVNRSPRAS